MQGDLSPLRHGLSQRELTRLHRHRRREEMTLRAFVTRLLRRALEMYESGELKL